MLRSAASEMALAAPVGGVQLPGQTRVVAIPGQLLTDAEAGQREAHLVRDNGCNRVAVERSGVEPEHRAGGEPVG